MGRVMDKNLIELRTEELLQKFGVGSHKPGSGSAAALQGMLSAQLIQTVIKLTNDEKRKQHYKEHLSNLLAIASKIERRIYPSLEKLFQKDSDQFDKVIKLRQARDDEEDSKQENQLETQALQELKPATEIPIEIGELCAELAGFAVFVFDHGFKGARGDSGVALNSAVSAVSGCLSIINLNLLSFESDEWTEKIRLQESRLISNLRKMSSETTLRLEHLRGEADQKKSLYLEINAIRSGIQDKSKLSYSDIEEIAEKLQSTMWKNRRIIWKYSIPQDQVDILKPGIALKRLDFKFERVSTLGEYQIQGRLLEISGQIDKQQKKVKISKRFQPVVQNFTAAHELGHALLHQQNVLHRDRALDGSVIREPRSIQELQADKFASYFLMPRKLVENVFEDLYLTKKFVIKEDTAFALNAGRTDELRAKCKNLRGLARILASTEFFNGRPFLSISKKFSVSVEAMAIRLEELELVEF